MTSSPNDKNFNSEKPERSCLTHKELIEATTWIEKEKERLLYSKDLDKPSECRFSWEDIIKDVYINTRVSLSLDNCKGIVRGIFNDENKIKKGGKRVMPPRLTKNNSNEQPKVNTNPVVGVGNYTELTLDGKQLFVVINGKYIPTKIVIEAAPTDVTRTS